ncbi:hypothetical protein J2S00_004063 [Caldalkalibacillus uzonensis]|uniref:ISLre2 family transposase n=1 Tax=Caldalkalibacillus uzonensis TaxID=353224 RepID=A0ABU0CYI1_9BACI|nr:UPF0236 family protein [Caldalkalibacillus uzonensis]MDQ0341204.1 hypothetical protein [Caldalkalibacillus uzonensis]
MKQFSINIPKLKEIEQMVWRIAQDICLKLTENILEELDQYIAEHLDTDRYKLKEKRPLGINLLFGLVEVKRNYYYDREKGENVYLLDRFIDPSSTV